MTLNLENKICTKCGKSKSISKFVKKRNGYRSQCKACTNKVSREWYKKNHKRRVAQQKEYNKLNQSRRKKTARKRLLNKYDLSVTDYDNLYEKQNGRCKICGDFEHETNKFGTLIRLSVDHDHKTGKVRGLLCKKCNRGLGSFNDDIRLLIKALNYLQEV